MRIIHLTKPTYMYVAALPGEIQCSNSLQIIRTMKRNMSCHEIYTYILSRYGTNTFWTFSFTIVGKNPRNNKQEKKADKPTSRQLKGRMPDG